MSRVVRFCLVGFFLLAAAKSTANPQTYTFAQVDEIELMLDLYVPDHDSEGTPSPVMVWVHGGAWRAGSRKNPPARKFVELGYAVASVDYRLTPVAPFPANVHDIKAAIRYLRANAGKLGIDPECFIVSGSSAGGHLAALVGVTNGHPELEGEVGDDLAVSSDVQAAVVYFGASNLTTILDQSTPHGLGVRIPALQLLLRGQPEDKPDLARLASPVFHVDANDPSLLLLHGDQDHQMPINQAHELHGALKAFGVPVEFIVLHGSGHGGPAFYDEERMRQVDTFLRTADLASISRKP